MTVAAAPPLSTTPVGVVALRRSHAFWPWGVGLLAVATLVVTGWGVGDSMSDYYGAIALSMSQSWSNFFFGAMDPAGTVTLDKIPGSFWIPALFVKVFGFSPWATVFPNALAATASVVITAFTVRRWAGPVAGLVAAAVVATTPILVAVSRSNQPEMFFVLTLALTAWAATKALEGRSLRWLVLAGVFIAAGFHTYMLEAWAVWPALAVAYLCTRQSWRRRIGHLAIAGTLSLALSLVWIVAVWLIPASARPYIGSTVNNSPWEMVFGYNGLGRFGDATEDASAYRSFSPPYSGDPGVLRLLNEALATQIGWLLPTTLVAVAALIVLRFRMPLTVFTTTWFATFAIMFSVVDGMHQFYTTALAIPMALLIGTAFAVARARGLLWPQLALPLTAALTALGISLASPATGLSLIAAIVQCALAVAAAVLALREARRGSATKLTATVGVMALLLTPAAWSAVTMTTPNSTNPVAAGVSTTGSSAGRSEASGSEASRSEQASDDGPSSSRQSRRSSGGSVSGITNAIGGSTSDAATIAWLEEHRDGETYLAAAFGAQTAAGLIIASDGEAVLPIGGFNSRDPVPTLAAFEQLVADGELRYVVTSRTGRSSGSSDETSTSAQIRSWVLENCTAVTGESVSGVYDCG
ncbi:MAG: glycosyltransferase family 39 protein [Microbacterium sp.]